MNAAIKHVISGLLRKKEIIKGMKIERPYRQKLDSSNNELHNRKKLEKKILQTFGSSLKRIHLRQEF